MTGLPAILVVAAVATVVLGLPLGLYALLTRGRRRTLREIRGAASQRGWQFRRRRFLHGDPSEFDIHGPAGGPLAWVVTCRGSGVQTRGWSVRLELHFPALAGEADFAVLPRESETGRGIAALAARASSETLAKIAKFSGAAAGAAGFFRDAKELPTGFAEFDAAYQVLAVEGRLHEPLVDAALARRVLEWPADCVQPHSVLAWRDLFGLHVVARLPGAPNSATVSYLVALGDMIARRAPAAVKAAVPSGIVDRIARVFLRS